VLQWGSPTFAEIMADFGLAVAGGAAAASCIGYGSRSQGRHRTTWILLGVSAASSAVGNTIRTVRTGSGWT